MLRLFLIIVFIIYVILVSYLCLSKPTGISDVGSLDKIAHILGYATFAILGSLIAKTRMQLSILLVMCALYGIIIEYLQGLTGYRTSSINDGLANMAGLVIGVAISGIIHNVSALPAFNSRQEKKR